MSISKFKNKVVVVLGPTASGKSDLAVRLAKKFNGEVISADSRQVYRGLDIGTGKVPRDRSNANRMRTNEKRIFDDYSERFAYYSNGVRHHLIDFVNPKRQYTVAEYQKAGRKILHNLFAIGHLPIICGGTGFYIDALLSNQIFPKVSPDIRLRKKLEKESAATLFARLQKLDPRRAKTIDRFNKRRLIRALEIVLTTGKSISIQQKRHSNILKNVGMSSKDILKIGIALPPEKLKKRIHARLIKRLRQDMVGEVKRLRENGMSWKRLDDLGLEYRYISRYLRSLISKKDMIKKLDTEIWRYAKRQMTWWKRDPHIHWISSVREAEKRVREFIYK